MYHLWRGLDAVAIMVVVAMLYFWLVDAGVLLSVNTILKLASPK